MAVADDGHFNLIFIGPATNGRSNFSQHYPGLYDRSPPSGGCGRPDQLMTGRRVFILMILIG
jgi:hypothetical protein